MARETLTVLGGPWYPTGRGGAMRTSNGQKILVVTVSPAGVVGDIELTVSGER